MQWPSNQSVRIRNGMTVREALYLVSNTLAQKGFENPTINAELLLCFIRSCRRVHLHLNADRFLNHKEATSLQKALERRLNHTPLQYIAGTTQFLSFEFSVNADVFIPRPETEILVEKAMKRIRITCSGVDPHILVDLGTGCGNIAIALAHAFPRTHIFATDISEKALSVARENANRNNLSDRITFLHGDLFEPLGNRGLEEKVDACVCNPPYIVRSEMKDLPPEVRDFEPRMALDGGGDGLDVVRRIIPAAHTFLSRRGLLALEIGQGQSENVRRMMFARNQYSDIEVTKDLNNVERVMMGVKKGTLSD